MRGGRPLAVARDRIKWGVSGALRRSRSAAVVCENLAILRRRRHQAARNADAETSLAAGGRPDAAPARDFRSGARRACSRAVPLDAARAAACHGHRYCLRRAVPNEPRAKLAESRLYMRL